MIQASASAAPEIFRARIDNVHHGKSLVDVTSLFGNKSIKEVELGALYQHPDGPEGDHVEPEVGALVLVCVPGDGSRAVCFCYVQRLHPKRGAQGDKPTIGPGDHVLESRDGNFVAIRRGGIIEVRSTPLCQSFWLPITNTLRHIYSNLEAKSLLGEMSWRHATLDPTRPSLETEVLFIWKGRRLVEDEKETITIRSGHVPVDLYSGASQQSRDHARDHGQLGAQPTVFEIQVAPNGGAAVYTLRVDQAGNVLVQAKGGATFEFTGPVYVKTESSVRWQGAGGLLLDVGADGGLVLDARQLSATLREHLLLKAPQLTFDGLLSLGGPNGKHPAILGDELLNFLTTYVQSHMHDPMSGAPVGGMGWVSSLRRILSRRVMLTG